MPSDIHKKPFDEGTVAKLEIFEDYAEAWLPTFVMSGARKIAIFDFFAGPGYDVNRVPGSAIRILKQVKHHIDNIKVKGTRIEIYLNEYVGKKLAVLKEACQDFLTANPDVNSVVNLHYSNNDF